MILTTLAKMKEAHVGYIIVNMNSWRNLKINQNLLNIT